MANIDKRFKALSFVWLLLCLLATHIYAENADIEGLFMRVFLYGVFASPVWLTYGWSYLYDEAPIKSWFYIPTAFGYIIWVVCESMADGYNPAPRVTMALLSGLGFLLLAYPRLHIPSVLQQLCSAINPFHGAKAAPLITPPSNHAIYFAARVITSLLLWFAAMVVLYGYAAHNDMMRYRVNAWVINILPFVVIVVFTKRIGFVRKAMRLLGVLLGYFAAVWLLDEAVAIIVHLLGINDIADIVRVVKMQRVANMALLIVAYCLLYSWLRQSRRALEAQADAQAA